jgi:hypothetical protein
MQSKADMYNVLKRYLFIIILFSYKISVLATILLIAYLV